jgi:hypothetical protein
VIWLVSIALGKAFGKALIGGFGSGQGGTSVLED